MTPPTSSAPLVSMRGVGKTFDGDFEVLHALDLDVTRARPSRCSARPLWQIDGATLLAG